MSIQRNASGSGKYWSAKRQLRPSIRGRNRTEQLTRFNLLAKMIFREGGVSTVTKLVPVNTKSGVMHDADIRKPPYVSCAEYSNKYIYDDMADVDARCLHGDTQTNTLCNIRPHYDNTDFRRKRQFDLMECVLPDEDPRETNDRENRVAKICSISEDESDASDAPVTDTNDDDDYDSDEECVNMGGCCGHGIISTTTMATQTPASCLRVLAAVAQVATPMAEPVEPAEPANAAAYGDVTEGEEDEDEDCVWIPPVPVQRGEDEGVYSDKDTRSQYPIEYDTGANEHLGAVQDEMKRQLREAGYRTMFRSACKFAEDLTRQYHHQMDPDDIPGAIALFTPFQDFIQTWKQSKTGSCEPQGISPWNRVYEDEDESVDTPPAAVDTPAAMDTSVLDSSDDAPYTLEQMKVYVQHIPWSYDTTPGSADGSSLSPVQQIHKNFEEFNRGFKTTRSGRKYT